MAELISNCDEKENGEKRGNENGERNGNVGTLSPVDIENITNLVQGELCSIRQIIETNRNLMNQIKVRNLSFSIRKIKSKKYMFKKIVYWTTEKTSKKYTCI